MKGRVKESASICLRSWGVRELKVEETTEDRDGTDGETANEIRVAVCGRLCSTSRLGRSVGRRWASQRDTWASWVAA